MLIGGTRIECTADSDSNELSDEEGAEAAPPRPAPLPMLRPAAIELGASSYNARRTVASQAAAGAATSHDTTTAARTHRPSAMISSLCCWGGRG